MGPTSWTGKTITCGTLEGEDFPSLSIRRHSLHLFDEIPQQLVNPTSTLQSCNLSSLFRVLFQIERSKPPSMDAKASAKSKRAHSLQAKRAHSHPNPKNPNKPQKQKNPDKTLIHQSRLLPSNRDRYDEDEEALPNEGFDKSVADSGPAQGIVAPKSKGADFSELIAQAREEARVRTNPDPDCFGSFDDVFSGNSTDFKCFLCVCVFFGISVDCLRNNWKSFN